MTNQRIEHSMKILLLAGDARAKCMEALSAISNQEIDYAKKLLNEAQEIITNAHKVQTEIIQEEICKEYNEYSLLFSHAQDTLMTICSEINIAKQLIKIFTQYNQRLCELEKVHI
ncbi:PTS system cellobiose-specific IIA component [Breznakia sp. PF5-3]|uniref:PTS lactose/cellobiose transporter subunit IIA n=1 Tax=unclassified Breznakia TaxID=2623764 RepID=UPI002404E99E|nr:MULTISPECIES: PTS lactose/cellobiose transporter subunit IIA [unclassified Breznakia]MDF9824292.1 PTS system cellobiose-specific IIA component [Breznakia sp. PM6-1]MDF9835516.1 PTS system cellobiose-specific IIA component [Breznakia sp. PF5-3]MDF9838010.1 PTS system cellobiose-specific IIA component [Breznakia sp. PFB2-8]MDF9859388.1 PTS system cellobiose-specific IIA component [Breznakia sp. PH5-24]